MPNFKTPRYHNFNVSIQQELFKNNVLTLGYSGQRGRDLVIYYDANASPIGSPCNDETSCDPLRPLVEQLLLGKADLADRSCWNGR